MSAYSDGIERSASHHRIYRCEMCRRDVVPEFAPPTERYLCPACAYLFRMEPLGDWIDDAVCTQTDPEAFFPQHDPADPFNLTPSVAKRICETCPVKQECGDYATRNAHDLYGVWGGMTRGERMEKRRKAA